MYGNLFRPRITKGKALYTAGFERPYVMPPCKTTYRRHIAWSHEIATHHKLGEWGEWLEIPFQFIPVRSVEHKWIWGRGVYVSLKPHGVDFEHQLIDAELKFDRKKNIFMRKLQGGA